MSGWWERRSSNWRMVVLAQVGGAAGLGAGAFALLFRCPELRPRQPLFVVVAGGAGIGGSIGSGASIPYSSIFRKLINSKDAENVEEKMFNELNGSFSLKDINFANFTIAQAGGSAAIVGAQVSTVQCSSFGVFGGKARDHFSSKFAWPKNLKEFGAAALDLPQAQGGIGAGINGFSGPIIYLGCN